MSRISLSFHSKLLPAALAAALVMLGSSSIANAQYYTQNPPDQGAPPDQYGSPQDQYAQTDPSNRVARLAYISGDVEFAPAGEDTWGSADVNRPLITGDRLLTGDGGRAALELGDAALRINDDSAFNFLDLNDTTTQVELTQGTLNLRVRRLGDGQTYEVDTPTVAFVANQPGTYRVDVAPSGNGAMVTVFEGSGTVYGENGVSRPVQAGQSYRFDDSTLANVAVQGMPAPDDFDRFCEARDSRWAHSVSRRYVSPDVVGYDDLDQYGDWQPTPDYGEVWYPTQVATGWAPYRDGHWAWIDPWGWTWVDDEPWGYAPFHYGRWVYVSDRWGWIPGPVDVEPVYAPALVAFVGGAGFSASISIGGGGYGQPVGWFPLGPRDVYVPPYRASQNYFTNINVTNIRNTYVNKTVINNYYNNYAAGRPYAGARQYAYRDNPRAFTAVPRNVFASAKPVMPAVLHVKPAALAKASVAPIPHVAPTRASLAITPPKRPITKPVAKAFNRTVVARHAPPPRPVPFAAREKVIAKQGGAPIPVTQLRQMRQQHAPAQPERVHVVAAAKPGARAPAPTRPAKAPVIAPRAHAPQPPPNRAAPPPNPAAAAAASRPKQPLRPGELPSARFAHQQGRAEAPRQHAEQARQNAQPQATPAQQNRQSAEQARHQAQQANQNEPAQAQQARQQAQEAQARQRDQQRAQQVHSEQERARQQQQQAEQQKTHQEQQQHAQQEQQQRAQQEQQQRAQQEQQRAQQEQQRRAQEEQQRAQQEQQRRAQEEQQQHAQQEQQQRAQQEQQQRAQQEQQRAQQEQQQRAQQEQQQRAQQEQQQREQQMRQQQEQQRQAQMQQQRAEQQRQRHAPPPPPKKKKGNDQQDNGGH